MSFVKAVQNFSRLRTVVNILFKEGFGEFIGRLGFKTHLSFEKRVQTDESKKVPKSHMAVRLRRAMEQAGGAYVKLGQMLSLRADLIPQDYCDEFAKLQDGVKPISYSVVKKVVESEFGKPIDKVFVDFDKKPLAAASVAQVHKAKLKNGQIVAVKVQRPTIAKAFMADIQILQYIAGQAEKFIPEIRPFNPTRIVEEFEKYTKNELDFLSEARNIETFHKKYKYSQHIRIPRAYWDYTTSKVVTMTYLDGKKVSQMKNLTKKEKKKVAMIVYKSFMMQVFEMHTFHADPHPGNIFVLKDGKIAFLDFGIVGKLSPDLTDNIESMVIALVNGDIDRLAYSFIDLGMVEDIDIDKFKQDLYDSWAEYHGKSNDQINMRKFFGETFELARKYKIEYPGNFVLLAKAIITIQSMGETLYPESNFIQNVRPQAEKLLRKRHSPKRVLKEAKKNAFNLAWTFRKFPQDLRSLVTLIKKGATVKVDIDNKDVKHFTQELDRSSNRVTFGLIICGLVIAAGLIILSESGPIILGVPMLAWLCFAVVLMLSFALVISIVRENIGGEL